MKKSLVVISIASLVFVFNILKAEAFTVSPISIKMHYSKSKNNSTVQLIKNDNNLPIAVVVTLKKRDILPNSEEKLTDVSDELVVFPSQLVVPAKGQRTIKVTYLGKDIENIEKAYRVIVTESPIDLDPITSGASKLKYKVAYASPLYVSPNNAKSDIRVSIVETSKEWVKLNFSNQGNKHQSISNPRLEIENNKNPKQIIKFEKNDLKGVAGVNILAMHNIMFTLRSSSLPSWVTKDSKDSKVRLLFDGE